MHAVIFCGLQGSGKTTFYQQRLSSTHIRLSLDMLKTRHRQEILMHACFAAQQPFVIDNTNPLATTRSNYVNSAKAADFRVTLYWFAADIPKVLERNSKRPPAQRVPNVAIFGTRKKFQDPTPAEGYDEMFIVKTGEDGQFVVEPFPK